MFRNLFNKWRIPTKKSIEAVYLKYRLLLDDKLIPLGFTFEENTQTMSTVYIRGGARMVLEFDPKDYEFFFDIRRGKWANEISLALGNSEEKKEVLIQTLDNWLADNPI